jgi:hypothetical protein
MKKVSSSSQKRRKRSQIKTRNDSYIYFDNATVVDTLPGTMFKVKVVLPNIDSNSREENCIYVVARLWTKFIKMRLIFIKGDTVDLEVDPEDMYFDEETKVLKGVIIARKS